MPVQCQAVLSFRLFSHHLTLPMFRIPQKQAMSSPGSTQSPSAPRRLEPEAASSAAANGAAGGQGLEAVLMRHHSALEAAKANSGATFEPVKKASAPVVPGTPFPKIELATLVQLMSKSTVRRLPACQEGPCAARARYAQFLFLTSSISNCPLIAVYTSSSGTFEVVMQAPAPVVPGALLCHVQNHCYVSHNSLYAIRGSQEGPRASRAGSTTHSQSAPPHSGAAPTPLKAVPC